MSVRIHPSADVSPNASIGEGTSIWHQACNPVALNSGTSALHLALIIANVREGDEVIIPAQTFVATGLVVLMVGAKPVFADIDPTTGNISPTSILEKITSRTKAIIPVHWGGYPCDMDEINKIAGEYNLNIIEDAAHALGATYKGKTVGALSKYSAFSFQAIKHLTTGDGGALCFLEGEDANEGFIRRWFGIDRANSEASILGERQYDIQSLGFKYHMNDIAAAVGLGNLEDFSSRLARRRKIADFYRSELSKCSGLQLLDVREDRTHAYWLFTVLVDRREDFIKKLDEEKIPVSVVHLRIDHNSIFGGLNLDLSGQAEFNEKQISIPVHEALTDVEVEEIVKTIRSGW
jgi:perosamine synthetase